MASSNRHWPSMFKSKPAACNSHQQWQQEINPSLLSKDYQTTPNSSGSEERSPEVKSRWNPRPEQIQILEAIFNSGMVNPPRDEIRKIRAQLQEYGKVGDANVFYWFQNRKSRTKHKQRQLQNTKPRVHHNISSTIAIPSSSSEKSSSNNSSEMFFSPINPSSSISSSQLCPSNSPTASVNNQTFLGQTFFFTTNNDDAICTFPFSLPAAVQQQGGGFSTSTNHVKQDHLAVVVDHDVSNIGHYNCSGFLPAEAAAEADGGDGLLMMMSHDSSNKGLDENMKLQQNLSFTATSSIVETPICPTTAADLSTINIGYQGNEVKSDERGSSMVEIRRSSTVFVNDVAIEVMATAPFNVREAFGEDAVLLHSSGQPVLTDDLGVTLHPLQHAAFYYLINTTFPTS